jgi:glutamate-5-semialdehyde dehydrogenase
MSNENTKSKVNQWTAQASRASKTLAIAGTTQKNDALRVVAKLLRDRCEDILHANAIDCERSHERLNAASLDRLTLTSDRIEAIATAVEEIVALPDPVGRKGPTSIRPNGLEVCQMSIPLGVIMMVFESRPNVAIDAGALCLKAGNATILRGGRESMETCKVFQEIFHEALETAGLDRDCVTLVDDPDRALVSELLTRSEEIDLVIPRGGESLIRAVTEQSRIPVIQHFKGVCHLYLAQTAQTEEALAIAINGKTQRPGVCNAVETILVDRNFAGTQQLIQKLRERKVEVRGCGAIQKLHPEVKAATQEDWDEEYLDLIVAIRQVDGLDEALEHIRAHSSNHTEAIVSQDYTECVAFEKAIQSSTVVINASTRFADGGELGLGAEIGISTSKLHAYGPMGLQELTTKKFVVRGNGQIRN